MAKPTPAQAYAIVMKADRLSATIERRQPEIAADNARVKAMYAM